MKSICTVTTYSYLLTAISNHTKKEYKTRDHRIVGFFDSVEKAKLIVINHSENLYEYIYEYLIIEQLEEGLYPKVLHEEWFIFDKKLKAYVPSLKPSDFKGVSSFSIG